ncbi:MAG: DUF1934 domain-containing protein [Clostridiales bacterium]|nr:DUF1934 domain-containing protein [Clostridiales bacterium]
MNDRKGIPILISLDARFSAEGQEEDSMRLITTGELEKNAEGYVIRYEESIDEDSPPHQVEIAMKKDVISMNRKGSIEADMVFEKGKRFESRYRTPYGAMDMAVFCTKAAYTVDRYGGEIALQYQLDLGNHFAAMHNMNYHFMRKKSS